MARNKTTPQVPGATPTPSGQDNQGGDPNVNPGENLTNSGVGPEDTVTVKAADLDALMSRLAQLEQKVQSPVARIATPEAELPSAEDFAGVELKSPVLTKDGWLVPEKMGSSPSNRGL